jgi:hypothetical protein
MGVWSGLVSLRIFFSGFFSVFVPDRSVYLFLGLYQYMLIMIGSFVVRFLLC